MADDAGAQASLDRYIAANPQDSSGHLMLSVIHGFAGRTDSARRAVAEAVRHQADIDQEHVRRSNRYRDPARSERVMAVLNKGLPT
jgi:predicted Zn-dependent protease